MFYNTWNPYWNGFVVLRLHFRDLSLTNAIHRVVHVGVYLGLKVETVIVAPMGIIIFQIVVRVIVIQREQDQINAMKMVYANVTKTVHAYARY